MPAPNHGDCPYCKAKKSMHLDHVDKNTGKEFWKCGKCGDIVSK